MEKKCDPHYGFSHLISMHAKRLESSWIGPFVEKKHSIKLDYWYGQAQRLCSHLNRNALICDLSDLHILRIHKKVLRKGSFKAKFN